MSSFQYVGHKPEHIVGIPAGDISEAEYEALSWELQQAVLQNKGSNGGPLYVERATPAERRAVTRTMTETEEEVVAPSKATESADTPAKEGT